MVIPPFITGRGQKIPPLMKNQGWDTKNAFHGSTLLAARMRTAARVLGNGRARPGYPGRLGSGGGSAFGAGRFQHARPSLGVSGGSVSVTANLTKTL